MTKLLERKTRLMVETPATERERGKHREIVITFQPWGMAVRLKGCRQAYPVSYNSVYTLAARQYAEQLRREKIEARKKNKKEK